MPTAGADVAFGLGRLHLPEDEVTARVQEALEIVGMGDYIKVRPGRMKGEELMCFGRS
jgi:energy-coupling factor transporter ATP-binding protein EcfA2